MYLTKTSLWIDMSLHSDPLSCFRANQILLFLLNAACLAETHQTPISESMVRCESSIYCTRDKHINYYTKRCGSFLVHSWTSAMT